MFRILFSSRTGLRTTLISITLVVIGAISGLSPPPVLAQADGFIAYGTTVTGEVRTHAGEEWFFTGCADDVVTINMSSDEFDTYIELYGPTGRRPLIEDDGSKDDGNALIVGFELPESGAYTIVAAGAARRDRGEYALALDSDRDADMEEETTLVYDSTVTGEVSTIRGEEWSFWGCAEDIVTLSMESDEFAGYLELYGPTGRRPLAEAEAEIDDAVVEVSELTLPESGVYTVVAAGSSRRDRGLYSLSLLTAASDDRDQDEVVAPLTTKTIPATVIKRKPAPAITSSISTTITSTLASTPTVSSSISTTITSTNALTPTASVSISATIVSTPTVTPTVSIPTPTVIPPSPTPTVSPPTSTPIAVATATPRLPAIPGLITDFETWGSWRRGDEAWGTFSQSSEQVHGGRFAGEFDYAFPANEPRNYLVYQQLIPIQGDPTALTMWVYGDGSGNFVNVWVRDANQQTWQFTFGRVYHTGWRQMSAPLDLSLGWPNQAVGSSSTDAVAYPIQLAALIVDGADEDLASKGSIMVDDLIGTTKAVSRPQVSAVQSASTPQPEEEPAAAPSIDPVPAPVALGYHFPVFKWTWKGMTMMENVDNWYFDVKIFDNEFSEYPYDVHVAEVVSVVADGPDQWRFDKRTDFRCGSYWSVQIAKRNPDGSYAGPLSSESNRVPTGQGCAKPEIGEDSCPHGGC